MSEAQIAELLQKLGCPAEKAPTLAAQLAKRAAQLAERQGRTYEESLEHLLRITLQGGGFSSESHD